MSETTILPSGLYLVATPIGNLGDITYRAIKTLAAVDIIYCEDTRKTRVLLQHYCISSSLETYHEHNAEVVRPKIIAAIEAGKSIALVSDAGMPLISDPGYKLVRACIEAKVSCTVLPGPSASLAGLVLSGLPTDQFFFAGFYDAKKASQYRNIAAPLIYYESAKRIRKSLISMSQEYPERTVAVAREITKLYEEVVRGTFDEVLKWAESKTIKGEIVVTLSSPSLIEASDEKITKLLTKALKTMRVKEASELVAADLNINRRRVYQLALELKEANSN